LSYERSISQGAGGLFFIKLADEQVSALSFWPDPYSCFQPLSRWAGSFCLTRQDCDDLVARRINDHQLVPDHRDPVTAEPGINPRYRMGLAGVALGQGGGGGGGAGGGAGGASAGAAGTAGTAGIPAAPGAAGTAGPSAGAGTGGINAGRRTRRGQVRTIAPTGTQTSGPGVRTTGQAGTAAQGQNTTGNISTTSNVGVTLSPRQRTRIRTVLMRDGNIPRLNNPTFNVSLGTMVPSNTQLVAVPAARRVVFPFCASYQSHF